MAKQSERIETSDQMLMVTTGVIREHYTRRKSQCLGSAYKPSPRHCKPEYWVNAAKQCLRLGANPQDYIDAAFNHCRQKGGPFPNALAGEAAAEWYRRYARDLHDPKAVNHVQVDGQVVPMEDMSMMNLVCGLDVIKMAMFNRSGDASNVKSPENLETLRMRIIPLWAPGRVLLGFPDPQVMEDFGQIAYDHFMSHPGEIQAARLLKLPIDEMLKWIQIQHTKA